MVLLESRESDHQAMVQPPRVKPLLGAITETDDYQEATPRMLSHDQLRSALKQTTGFTWTQFGRDLLDSDETGYRLLFGGVDGIAITTPQREPGLTWALGVQQAAEGAADHVVRTELEEDGERRLFDDVTLTDRPGDEAFDAALRGLHRKLFSTEERAGGPDAERMIPRVDGVYRVKETILLIVRKVSFPKATVPACFATPCVL